MRPRVPAWRNLASQNEKYAYRYQNMMSHGPTKRLPDLYIMHFPNLKNGLTNCVTVS